jgi:hypothetical protein
VWHGQSPQLMQFGSLLRKRSHENFPFFTIDVYAVAATQLYLESIVRFDLKV